MAQISIGLIDALLQPSHDRSAEETFKSISLPERVNGLFHLLSSLSLQDVSRSMLTCVLLRRDISSLGEYTMKHMDQGVEITKMLGIFIAPLLNIMHTSGMDAHAQRLIGHVIAEVCSVLSLLDPQLASNSVSIVLDKIADGCSKADKPSLEVLALVAQRAPFTIQAPETLIQVLQSAILNVTGQPQHGQLSSIQAILDAMCQIGTGTLLIATCPRLSNDPKERMVQMIQMQSITENNPKKMVIDSTSTASAIGKACLPGLFQVLYNIAMIHNSNDDMETVMQSLSHIASTCPSILAGDGDVFHNVSKILLLLATKAAEDDVRLIALEALSTLISVPDVRKLLNALPATRTMCISGDDQNGISGMVKLCASMICTGVDDDVDAWAKEEIQLHDELAEYEYDDTAVFSESILETFLQNIGGGPQSLQVTLSIVEPLLASQDWAYVRGGLSLLEICLKTSPHSFSSHVPTAVEAALTFATHACIRVQFQSIQLISTLCIHDVIESSSTGSSSSSRPVLDLRNRYGTRILEILAQQVGNACGKVVCYACMAIVSYCRGGNGKLSPSSVVDKEAIIPSLGNILTKIGNGPLSLDISSHIVVFIRAFSAVACLASVVEEDFAELYGFVMPGLMSCISYGLEMNNKNYFTGKGSTAHDLVSLRGSAIETASIVGASLGAENELFRPDAKRIMHIIVSLVQCLQGDSAPLIPQDQLFSASARISSVIGAAYIPYVPSILPHLLRVATEKADVSIVDGDDSVASPEGEFDEDTGMQSITLNLPGMGIKKLMLNTTQMQEKSQAARAVYEHANSLGASFGPYTKECLDAFLPLVSFNYSSDVRSTAAQAVGQIFDALCQFVVSGQCNPEFKQYANEVYSRILEKVAKQAQSEEDDDIEALLAFSDAMSTLAYAAYNYKYDSGEHVAKLNINDAKIVVAELIKNTQSSLQRRASLIAVLYDGSLDEDQLIEYEDVLNIEAEFLTGVVDSIGYTLKSMKEDFLPIFDSLVVPFFGPLLKQSTNVDSKARFGAICLFDDCVEHLGPSAATKYAPVLTPAIVEGIHDDDTDIKEASVYGIIQVARYAPSALQASALDVIKVLFEVANEGVNVEKDNVENLRLVENSASALATMALFPQSILNASNVPKADLLRVFLHNLPIQEDYDEAKICHEGLCLLVENGDIEIQSNAKQLLNVMGRVAFDVSEGEEVASESTCSRMASILAELQKRIDPSVLQHMYGELSLEAQNGINALFG